MNIKRNLIQYFQFTDSLGWIEGTKAFLYSKKKSLSIYSLKILGNQNNCYLRSGTFDINTFRQVFVYKEYEFEVPFEVTRIIDCGGNIGLASVYFANRFPSANIICIEPDQSNFQLLKRNISAYKGITAVKAGVWHRQAHLSVIDAGYGHWGFMIQESESEKPDSIPSVSIPQIMKENSITEVDILKIDIEGSEKEVFSFNFDIWLPQSKIIVVELHDRMKEGTSRAVFSALLKYNFYIEQLGENLVCYREDVWKDLMNLKRKE